MSAYNDIDGTAKVAHPSFDVHASTVILESILAELEKNGMLLACAHLQMCIDSMNEKSTSAPSI